MAAVDVDQGDGLIAALADALHHRQVEADAGIEHLGGEAAAANHLPLLDQAAGDRLDLGGILFWHALSDLEGLEDFDFRTNNPAQRDAVYQGGVELHVTVTHHAHARLAQQGGGSHDAGVFLYLAGGSVGGFRRVVDVFELVAQGFEGIAQGGRAGLVGGRDQAAAFVVARQAPKYHRLVREGGDDVDHGMRGDPACQADHQQVKIGAAQFLAGAGFVFAGGIVADRRGGDQLKTERFEGRPGRLALALDQVTRAVDLAEANETSF